MQENADLNNSEYGHFLCSETISGEGYELKVFAISINFDQHKPQKFHRIFDNVVAMVFDTAI